MTDEAKGKGRHVGGKIKEKAGEFLGDREMEREGELSQQQGRAEQDRDRAQEAERDARDREAAAELEKERLKRKPGTDL